MPNWCENTLGVNGEPGKLRAFRKSVKGVAPESGEEVLLDENKLIPYPEKFRKMDAEAHQWDKEHPNDRAGRGPDGFNSGGYEWCIANWGTKWGFQDVEVIHENEGSVTYFFLTAWSPPLPLIRKAGELFPNLDFHLEYNESDGGIFGKLDILKGEVSH